VGMKDPNPRVAGAGLKQLKKAGIAVECGVLEDECRALNRPYLKWTREKRPWVTLKAAVTLDGRLAARGGDARWVSGELSRLEAHRMRDVSDAILVGANTVRLDDPALTTRLPTGTSHDPKRVILDGRLTISPDANALPGAIVACTKDADAARQKRLEKRGVTVTGVILGVVMAEVVHSIVTDRLVHSTAQAAVLLSSGHPYACGIVSPQIVALAESGARALANAKMKFAATLALLAGGAAAAGAQVVSHVGPWNLPNVSNWDLNRAFRWLFHPPSFGTFNCPSTVHPASTSTPYFWLSAAGVS